MKKFLLAFLFVSALAFGQTQVYVTTTGGTLKSTTLDTLATSTAAVTSVNINGTLTSGALGTMEFATPVLETGNFQTGATFGVGGQFAINAPGFVDYLGNFSSATWTLITAANGTHSYALTGSLTSVEGNGAFYCVTNTLPKDGEWVKSATLSYCQFSVILVF